MRGVGPRGARVVVTGAGSGIGAATAIRYAAHGAASVACVDIDRDSAEVTAAACRERGADSSAHACDVADWSAVAALAEAVEDDGPVDIAVNNAGVGVAGPYLEQTVEDWDWLIGINLNGVAYGCRAFGGPMVERGRGQIVNTASSAAFLMSRDMHAYCASKAGVVALTRCLRADWHERGVGVGAVCPGLINTPIPSRTRSYGEIAAHQRQIERAFRRGHSPDLVAKAIVKVAERNLEIIRVGAEAEVLYRALAVLPGAVAGRLARTSAGSVLGRRTPFSKR